jgi:ssDNA thymidine ADP-ribosyltransferase, DarT
MPTKSKYIWRMTDYNNIGFILKNGLHCCNCDVQDPDFISIGHKTLINSRGNSSLPIKPFGVLNDYIPFYFHYKMPMLYHIFKNKVIDYKGTQEDVIYLVSSIEKIESEEIAFLYTDRHAYLAHKIVYDKIEDIKNLHWEIIKNDDWHLSYSELKKELKQAEFLIHKHLPVNAILGIVVHNDIVAKFVQNEIAKSGLNIMVAIKPNYYY